MKRKKPVLNFAIVSILLVSSFSVWLAGNLGAFGINKIKFDVIAYHGYFPATFIKKDLSLNFYKDSSDAYAAKEMYWANFTEDKKPVLKTTYGLSLMYLPFTIWPYLFNKGPQTGYELCYSIAICVSNLFYFILAFILLYKILQRLRFSDFASGLTILCVGLGTNALAYASIGLGMSHAYGLFLTSALLYLTLRWHDTQSYKFSVLLGLVLGLLILIRPTNAVFIFCFFLFKPLDGNVNRFKFYLSNWKHLVLGGVIAFLVIAPQLLYWKYITGHYVYNSYVGEHFYFDRPHIVQYLFGFRKGWFVYTPLIIFAFIGLFYSRRVNPFFIATLIIVPLLVYINSSWWCWWFGGGYGARSMIETHPLLAVSFASFFDIAIPTRKKAISWACGFLILFNIKCVDLYRANIIHFDGMTYRAFIYTSFKILFSPEEKEYLNTLYKRPDYEKALRGEDS